MSLDLISESKTTSSGGGLLPVGLNPIDLGLLVFVVTYCRYTRRLRQDSRSEPEASLSMSRTVVQRAT